LFDICPVYVPNTNPEVAASITHSHAYIYIYTYLYTFRGSISMSQKQQNEEQVINTQIHKFTVQILQTFYKNSIVNHL
jgi:hypothetical protein